MSIMSFLFKLYNLQLEVQRLERFGYGNVDIIYNGVKVPNHGLSSRDGVYVISIEMARAFLPMASNEAVDLFALIDKLQLYTILDGSFTSEETGEVTHFSLKNGLLAFARSKDAILRNF